MYIYYIYIYIYIYLHHIFVLVNLLTQIYGGEMYIYIYIYINTHLSTIQLCSTVNLLLYCNMSTRFSKRQQYQTS